MTISQADAQLLDLLREDARASTAALARRLGVAAKRGLRCVALGSNNYLLARSETGGERATAMSSPIRTAELNGLDPQG